jgi:DNA polymerase-1
MNLLIIDGSNIAMRASFGGEIPPEKSTPTATGMIERAIRELKADHFMVALDCPRSETWRKKLYLEYKANRTSDTKPWIDAAFSEWSKMGWWVERVATFEADDLIATISSRATESFEVLVLSTDTDLLQIASENICVCKPVNGGGVSAMTIEMICTRHGIAYPELIVDLKALIGEDGDNVPGIEGIGPVRANELLLKYGMLEDVIAAGVENRCKMSAKVAQHADTARLAKRLISLDKSAPVENLLLKLYSAGAGYFLKAPSMIEDEQREYLYHHVERLGILGADKNPSRAHIEMAIMEAESAVERMRASA